jgi:mitogen-activated protein kinase kinase 1
MDAGSLTQILEVVKRIPEDILGLMTIQMLRGLDYLHRVMKVIHRDIKPSNILLNKKGQVKIADFGVSGKIEKTLDCLSSWVGTMTHMSPERLKGEGYYADTDMWSLGLVLLEWALGKFPFPLNTELNEIGFWEILTSIENWDPIELPSDEFRYKN